MNESYYSATAEEKFSTSKLCENVITDVCIIGGGIVALSCAQTLNENGIRVVIIEKEHIFSGASGLNGGFVVPGYALGLNEIEKRTGLEDARELFKISIQGVNKIKNNILLHKLSSVKMEPGKIDLLRYRPSIKELNYPEIMAKNYEYKIEQMEKEKIQSLLNTDSYCHGFFHPDGFHIHPLNYGFGLARQLEKGGVKFYEKSKVEFIKKINEGYKAVCLNGEITCREVIVCTGGYPGDEPREIKRSILPITTYVVTSEPNDKIPNSYIKTKYALGDNRRASDYYRLVDGNRVLWGGRITAFPSNNKKTIENKIRKDISNVFPDLSNIKFSYSWSGVMGYATHKMPYIGRLKNGIWYCTAFGGRGLGSGTACGNIVAKAVLGKTDQLKLFKRFNLQKNYGVVGKIAVEATYKRYIAKDYMKEKFNKNNYWRKK